MKKEAWKKVKEIIKISLVILMAFNIVFAIITQFDQNFWLDMYQKNGPAGAMVGLIILEWAIWFLTIYIVWAGKEERSNINSFFEVNHYAFTIPALNFGPVLFLILLLSRVF